MNAKALYTMYSALDLQESSRVKGCKDAQSIWKKLHEFHEGSQAMKEEKKFILVSQYESFKMLSNESIDDMFCRFNSLVKDLHDLGKDYPKIEINRKLLNGLRKEYRTKAIAIETSRDLAKLDIDELNTMLKVQEMRNTEEENSRPSKSIALKASKDKCEHDNYDSDDNLNEYELNLLSKHSKNLSGEETSR